MLAAKYLDHLLLCRQLRIFERAGMAIALRPRRYGWANAAHRRSRSSTTVPQSAAVAAMCQSCHRIG